ncbi:MAG TPA: hypothetical protein VFH56_13815 [Acidimicrobiales bacterium]|nr:hypothetical protein [Acidimicrobiales bacterium]
MNVVGGILSSSPADFTVVLHRDGRGSRFSGTYGPITAVDARGTLVGWTLSVSAVGPLPSGTITIHPDSPVTVSGNPGEVRAANPTKFGLAPAPIMVAAPGGGGGTFTDSGTVDFQSRSVAGDSVTLDLAVATS